MMLFLCTNFFIIATQICTQTYERQNEYVRIQIKNLKILFLILQILIRRKICLDTKYPFSNRPGTEKTS